MEERAQPEAQAAQIQARSQEILNAFIAFWHLLTTSRYTRLLESECAALKQEVRELKAENAKLAIARLRADPDDPLHTALMPKRRPGQFEGFSRAKQRLENLPDPQRSV